MPMRFSLGAKKIYKSGSRRHHQLKKIIRIPPFPKIERIEAKDRNEKMPLIGDYIIVNHHISDNDNKCPILLSVLFFC
jgi:hypothetical protein